MTEWPREALCRESAEVPWRAEGREVQRTSLALTKLRLAQRTAPTRTRRRSAGSLEPSEAPEIVIRVPPAIGPALGETRVVK